MSAPDPDAVRGWLARARDGQAAHVRPEVWAGTVELMTRAAHAAAAATVPEHAAAQVGWSAGWARGASVGIEDTASTVLRDLRRRELRLDQWAAQTEAAARGRPWEPVDGWDEDRVAAGRYTRAEENLARADHALRDVDRLRHLTGALLHRPEPDPLIPAAPAVPTAVFTALDQGARTVTDPVDRLVGFTANAWEIGTHAGRAAGTVTAVNHLARAAAGQRIRRMEAPGASRLVTPQEWARRSLARAYAYLTRILGEPVAVEAGLLPRSVPAPGPRPHLAALLDAFPGPPRPSPANESTPPRAGPATGRGAAPRSRPR